MSKADELLKKLQNSSIKKITEKESAKNSDVDDAHNNELINQSKNRTKFGKFAIDWVMSIITVASALLVFMTAFYAWEVIQNQEKLETVLTTVYSELKLFFEKYQTVLAVIATLMFGDKLKNKNKNDKN